MITISKADAQVIKSSTILSAYVICGAIAPIPVVITDLQADLQALDALESGELVDAAKRLVLLTIQEATKPAEPLIKSQAQQALQELADLLLQAKEI